MSSAGSLLATTFHQRHASNRSWLSTRQRRDYARASQSRTFPQTAVFIAGEPGDHFTRAPLPGLGRFLALTSEVRVPCRILILPATQAGIKKAKTIRPNELRTRMVANSRLKIPPPSLPVSWPPLTCSIPRPRRRI